VSVRLALGGIFHETNTYASPTSLADFAVVREEELSEAYAGTATYIGGILEGCAAAAVELVPTLYAEATPSGVITRDAFAELRDEVVDRVADTAPDAVLLALHGAGVCDGCDSIEEDLCAALQDRLGPRVPLVAALDLHGNLTPRLAEQCAGLFPGRLNPHIDQRERGREVAACAVALARGGDRPHVVVEPVPVLLTLTATIHPLLADITAMGERLERDPDVLVARMMHGFPYADLPHIGASIVAVGATEAAATDAARTLADELWQRREELRSEGLDPGEAVARAVALGGRVVINEFSDNTGAGAPGDGTHLLRALVDAGARACFSHVHDPETVRQAHAAGIGATIHVRLGGKTDTLHGSPLEAEAEVLTLGRGALRVKSDMGRGEPIDLGLLCALRIGAVDVIVTSGRRQTLDDGWFIKAGIDVEAFSIVAVKSSQHFRAYFESRVDAIVTADPPGLSTADVRAFARERLGRPVWPLDAETAFPTPSIV
jgi:microcystin degradation protein MlrC